MSERYGKCRPCGGTGKIQLGEQDFITGDMTYSTVECAGCGGTGHSGDAMEREE